jgi:DNA-binding response OmpR family regulator
MLKILHVEDDPDIREITAFSLGMDASIQLRTAASGSAAINTLISGFAPDVVLLDVMMPDLDGPATLAGIRSTPGHARTPIIFMTARTQAHEKSRYLALGAIGVITKPFDPMTLGEQVRAMLAGAKA